MLCVYPNFNVFVIHLTEHTLHNSYITLFILFYVHLLYLLLHYFYTSIPIIILVSYMSTFLHILKRIHFYKLYERNIQDYPMNILIYTTPIDKICKLLFINNIILIDFSKYLRTDNTNEKHFVLERPSLPKFDNCVSEYRSIFFKLPTDSLIIFCQNKININLFWYQKILLKYLQLYYEIENTVLHVIINLIFLSTGYNNLFYINYYVTQKIYIRVQCYLYLLLLKNKYKLKKYEGLFLHNKYHNITNVSLLLFNVLTNHYKIW